MYNFWTLTKFNLSYYLKPRFENAKDKRKFIVSAIILILVFAMPLAMMVYTIYNAASMAIQMNIVADFISVMLLASQIAVLFMGMASYLQIMYFGNDNEILMTLPVKPSAIYLSKLIVSLFNNLIISTVIILPSLITIAVAFVREGFSFGAEYYVLIPFALIFIPLLPLLIISVLSFPIMKIVSYFKKHPTISALITALLTVGIVLAIYLPSMAMGGDVEGDISGTLVGVMSKLGRYFYPTYCFALAMVGSQIAKNLAIFFAITLVALAIGVLTSLLFYRSTLSKMSEGGGVSSTEKKVKSAEPMSTKKALVMRELKGVMRDQSIALQTFMMLIMAPAMLLISTFVSRNTSPDEGETFCIGMFELGMSFFYSFMMIGGMNYMSLIGISRDREQFSIAKTLPVTSKQILQAKLTLSDLTTLLAVILSGAVFALVSSTTWYNKILYIIGVFACTFPLNCFCLMRDVKAPNLKWTNIKQISKNNMGTLVPMLVCVVGGIAVMILGITMSFLPMQEWLMSLIFWGVVAVIAVAFFFIFRFRKMDKMVEYFDKIEI
ncbi:MAG: hypothetical protein SO434_06480 [Eubacteriales bacterium]|nr:hypothetical protein [Eubacteriales bacterium]